MKDNSHTVNAQASQGSYRRTFDNAERQTITTTYANTTDNNNSMSRNNCQVIKLEWFV